MCFRHSKRKKNKKKKKKKKTRLNYLQKVDTLIRRCIGSALFANYLLRPPDYNGLSIWSKIDNNQSTVVVFL